MNAQVNAPETVNNFVTLSKINVNGHTEKKGRFTYLSWTFAVSEAMKVDPMTVWAFREPMVFPDGTMMVHCDVTMFGKSIYMFLPVMNNQNKAIPKPNAFDVNSAMMRCLVKAIAAHGLGLYIYAGEDLPEEEKLAQQQPQQAQQKVVTQEDLQRALADIESAAAKTDLAKPFNYFKGTQFFQQIENACRAKSDKEGWSA
ncbi:Sak single strand annealing protein [Acinetobacter pseudolwoffii]|uniref:Sak single strand annealing protein n=1 Tax=Acinetobacter pseudolwoffii TaxID=2053287 RepID=UPI002468F90D|nr:DUF1071 domain-containing protein [Acinetobacter pseudolwoffii]MDH5818974.1 DUF1071 domain-containing protein [Acinetobacter pseudolwoffii]